MDAIQDGTGKGYFAKVNQRNELQVQSRMLTQSALKCVSGDVFLLSTPFVTVSTTGGKMVWLLFSDPSKYLVVDSLHFNWNGGDTTQNKALKLELVVGDSAPTANDNPHAAANTNTNSTNALISTVKVWNGSSGDGMTIVTPGTTVGRMIVGQGYTVSEVNGRLIVGPGSTLSLNAIGEEAGEFTMSAYMYLFDSDVDG